MERSEAEVPQGLRELRLGRFTSVRGTGGLRTHLALFIFPILKRE